jgi:nitrogen fixation/metabolism regulation signal transduction histidine kinase
MEDLGTKDSPKPHSTRLLVIFSVLSLVSAEINIPIAYRTVFHDHAHITVPNVYEVCILLLLPALVGFRGFAIARNGLAQFADQRLAVKLSQHFLFGIIVTYAAISLIAMSCS